MLFIILLTAFSIYVNESVEHGTFHFQHNPLQAVTRRFPSVNEMERFNVPRREWNSIPDLFNNTEKVAYGARILSEYLHQYLIRHFLPQEGPKNQCRRALGMIHKKVNSKKQLLNEREAHSNESHLASFMQQSMDNGCPENLADQVEVLGDRSRINDLHPYPFCMASYYNQLPIQEQAQLGQSLKAFIYHDETTTTFKTAICPFTQFYLELDGEICILMSELLDGTQQCLREDIENLNVERRTWGEEYNFLEEDQAKRVLRPEMLRRTHSMQTGLLKAVPSSTMLSRDNVGSASTIRQSSDGKYLNPLSDPGRLDSSIQKQLGVEMLKSVETMYSKAVEDALPPLAEIPTRKSKLLQMVAEAHERDIEAELRSKQVAIQTAIHLFSWWKTIQQTAALQLRQFWWTAPTRKWRLSINLWGFMVSQYDFCLRLLIDEASTDRYFEKERRSEAG